MKDKSHDGLCLKTDRFYGATVRTSESDRLPNVPPNASVDDENPTFPTVSGGDET